MNMEKMLMVAFIAAAVVIIIAMVFKTNKTTCDSPLFCLINTIQPRWICIIQRLFWIITIITFFIYGYCYIKQNNYNMLLGIPILLIVTAVWVFAITTAAWWLYVVFLIIKKYRPIWPKLVKWFKGE